VELADTIVLETIASQRKGSSPFVATKWNGGRVAECASLLNWWGVIAPMSSNLIHSSKVNRRGWCLTAACLASTQKVTVQICCRAQNKIAICSPVRLGRVLWAHEIAGSNPAR
jgi:hypothetical protein